MSKGALRLAKWVRKRKVLQHRLVYIGRAIILALTAQQAGIPDQYGGNAQRHKLMQGLA